jgi:hypothetical protein
MASGHQIDEARFREIQQRLDAEYRKNKAAREAALRAQGVQTLPDFRTVDEVIDYYARVEEEQGAGAEEDI